MLRAALLALLLAAPLVVAPADAAPEPPRRYVIAFDELPPGAAPGDAFAGARIVAAAGPLGALVVLAPAALDLRAAAAADPRVRYVEEDPADAARVAKRPEDPLYEAQPHLETMRVDKAWQRTEGSASVTACIVDTGLRPTHEDLAGPRWLGGVNVVEPLASAADDHGHGTHVAGVLAASRDNGLGIAGVAQAGIRSAKALREDGAGPWSAVALGIAWCAGQGSKVIVLALGGPSESSLVADALRLARLSGALVVAAAGNTGPCESCVAFPARHPDAMAVACLAQDLAPCYDSAAGPEVEIAAVGEHILSLSGFEDEGYREASGTSAAAPHVAGVAALLWSVEPRLSADEVRARITCSATDLAPPGPDARTGAGSLDARAALRRC